MKMKYRIGLFAAILFFVSMLGLGYQLSYQYAADKQQAGLEKQEQTTDSVSTKGEAEKNDGFYLCELHGYVAVYLSDRATLYELTEIPLDSLPEEVQGEIREGKYIETTGALYGFLENYSS